MPRETILRVLHEALADTRSDLDGLISKLIEVFHGDEGLGSTEQVIALGFLVCARALRESSLMQEVAVREELQDLDRHVREILDSVRRTEQSVEIGAERRARLRRRGLVEDLMPEADAQSERRGGT